MIDEIRARLLETGTPFALVEGANELAEVKDRPPATPAAYVFISGERSRVNQRITGPVLQEQAVAVSVLLITENLAGRADAQRDVEALKTWTRRKLLGFVAGDADPLEHIEGELVQAKDAMVWFEDVFGASRYLEQEE